MTAELGRILFLNFAMLFKTLDCTLNFSMFSGLYLPLNWENHWYEHPHFPLKSFLRNLSLSSDVSMDFFPRLNDSFVLLTPLSQNTATPITPLTYLSIGIIFSNASKVFKQSISPLLKYFPYFFHKYHPLSLIPFPTNLHPSFSLIPQSIATWFSCQ